MQIESQSSECDSSECAICLQTCIHAVRLPCNHIFCYLCVKGAAHQSKRCAICRQQIPNNYFENPILINQINEKDVNGVHDECQWLYEGRNGWWLYDKRSNHDIDSAFKDNQLKCELMIAGFIYVIDFERMIQYRRYEPNRIRRIRRDKPDISSTKGVAGLRTNLFDIIEQQQQQQSADTQTQNETNGSEESTQSNSELTVTNDSETNDNIMGGQHQIEDNSISHNIESSETSESGAQAQYSTDSEENGIDHSSNGEDIDVVQLGQLLANSLTVSDTQETYL